MGIATAFKSISGQVKNALKPKGDDQDQGNLPRDKKLKLIGLYSNAFGDLREKEAQGIKLKSMHEELRNDPGNGKLLSKVNEQSLMTMSAASAAYKSDMAANGFHSELKQSGYKLDQTFEKMRSELNDDNPNGERTKAVYMVGDEIHRHVQGPTHVVNQENQPETFNYGQAVAERQSSPAFEHQHG